VLQIAFSSNHKIPNNRNESMMQLTLPATPPQSSTQTDLLESRSDARDVYRQDALYLRALQEIDGLGRTTLTRLLLAAGTPEQLWEASSGFLTEHLSPAKARAFEKRRDAGLSDDWLLVLENTGMIALPCTDPRYPPLLREIHQPPFLLYIKGNLEAVTGKTLAVVGTRKASEYGKQSTDKLIRALRPANPTIISGLAAGIDTEAHWAAIRQELPTVAVFGCGLDIIYPSTNRTLSQAILTHGGAWVSEYPLGMQPNRATFPQRNRIVAGLSQGVLVIEGDVKSGAMITAKLGLEEGRSIFAVPGNIFSSGSQGPVQLLRQGAIPVTHGEDILKELSGWSPSTSSKAALSVTNRTESEKIAPGLSPLPDPSQDLVLAALEPSERALLDRIPYDPLAIEALGLQLGWPSARINETLTLLELEGLIVQLPGAQVCRK
jgi:DNA processing protein